MAARTGRLVSTISSTLRVRDWRGCVCLAAPAELREPTRTKSRLRPSPMSSPPRRSRYGEEFGKIAATCRVWVNGVESKPADPVGPNDEVALLPPVSGG